MFCSRHLGGHQHVTMPATCQAPWFHETLRTLDLLRHHAEGLMASEALPVDLDVMQSDGLPPGHMQRVMGAAGDFLTGGEAMVGGDGFAE